MSVFTLETWSSISIAMICILTVIGIIALCFLVRAYRHRHEEKLYYDEAPTYVMWLVLVIVCCFFMCVIYCCCFTDTALINKTFILAKTRQCLMNGVCANENYLGCPMMWNQYRADSVWLETRLLNIK